MSCSKPLVAILEPSIKRFNELKPFSIPPLKKNGLKPVFLNSASYHYYVNDLKMPKDIFTFIPCGQCIDCRLDYSSKWSMRMSLEASNYSYGECWFITLTYDDDHLPSSITCYSKLNNNSYTLFPVVKRDLQLFLKRLRKHTSKHFKYYAVGEYGDIGNRPHYHLCVFGLPLCDLLTNPIFSRKNFDNLDFQLYESKIINNCWKTNNKQIGLACVAPFSYETAAYCSRYTLKKLRGKDKTDFVENIICVNSSGEIVDFPFEFNLISTKPSIGYEYAVNNLEHIYRYDSISFLRGSKVITSKPPRYFDSIYTRLFPSKAEKLKLSRNNLGFQTRLVLENKISINIFEYYKIKSISRRYRNFSRDF